MSDNADPTQTGELLEAVATGFEFTTASVDAELLHVVELFVTVRVYVPDIEIVALLDTVGLRCIELNPLGPVHA